MRKICVVTGTRSEYGLLSRLIKLIDESDRTQLQLIATNMHLSHAYGDTWREIEADGFSIDWKVPILDDGTNDAVATLKSLSKAVSGFADAFQVLRPDLVLILGDRYEMLAVAEVALIERIPIAHISGGAVSEGAFDDAIRHSITKMSGLHFTETEAYRRRVIQLGEQPDRVFNVGALGVENILQLPLLQKSEIEDSIGFEIDEETILVTYHPVTLGSESPLFYIDEFLSALNERPELRIIFTMPNSDTGSSTIFEAIDRFVKCNPKRSVAFKSLGVKRYLSVMKYVAAVVGNSSSGIVEAPSFGVPTLDIGDRQKGRLAAPSVFHCHSDRDSVMNGFDRVLSDDFRSFCKTVHNPYEKEGTAFKIFDIISTFPLEGMARKSFYDLNP